MSAADIGQRVDGRPLEMGGRCGHYSRHWFAPIAYLRTPKCVRCGAPNPRPLTEEEQIEYDEWKASRGR